MFIFSFMHAPQHENGKQKRGRKEDKAESLRYLTYAFDHYSWADFQGPDRTVPAGILTWDEYNAIVKAYPRLGLMGELKEVMCGLCKTKPATTYDNTVGEWGEMFVEGYSRDGHRTAEMLLSCDLDERVV